jgi:hypothetical protein
MFKTTSKIEKTLPYVSEASRRIGNPEPKLGHFDKLFSLNYMQLLILKNGH